MPRSQSQADSKDSHVSRRQQIDFLQIVSNIRYLTLISSSSCTNQLTHKMKLLQILQFGDTSVMQDSRYYHEGFVFSAYWCYTTKILYFRSITRHVEYLLSSTYIMISMKRKSPWVVVPNGFRIPKSFKNWIRLDPKHK